MIKKILASVIIGILIFLPIANTNDVFAATDIGNATIEWSVGSETTFLFNEIKDTPEKYFKVKLDGKSLDSSECIIQVISVNEKESKVVVQAYGIGEYSGQTKRITLGFDTVDFWTRLHGLNRYDTMKAIVDEGFTKKKGTVIVATGDDFKDALAASGLAGLYKAPVVLTGGKSLSNQARAVLSRLEPEKIYVIGGEFAIRDNVLAQIEMTTGIRPDRVYGDSSSSTSAAIAREGYGLWKGSTAIIVTNRSFKDALSIAPIAYVKGYPILLSDQGKELSDDVVRAMKEVGIRQVIIVGGTSAVSNDVESELYREGFAVDKRIEGLNGVLTSKAVAEWGISVGMKADRMGVATSQNYPDALAGAALCGYNGAVLVLADDKAMLNASFPAKYKSAIRRGYVFGGLSAVGQKTYDKLVESVAEIV